MSVREQNSIYLGAGRPLLDLPGRFIREVLSRLNKGRLVIELPDGRTIDQRAALPGPEAVLVLHDWRAVRRIVTGGAMGFAESHMAGEWSSPDLPSLIELLAVNIDHLQTMRSGVGVSRFVSRLWHRMHENSRRGSRRNISFHYDLGNAFYESWLDRGMQYSSAIYADGDSLEMAQQRKLDRIVDMLRIEGGERVLEIGFGWGAVAERLAADHNCAVTGLSLSQRQLDYAQARMADAGLAADLRLQDYRDCEGQFDRVVSIEMVEAVGEKYWRQYFDVLRERLVPGGRAVIQAITIDPGRFDRYRSNPDFIQRYVFPGGMLPTADIIRREVAAAGLVLGHVEQFGASYARTLADWRTRFHAAWHEIEPLGFDLRFRRMWDYYLAYCEGGFRAGSIDVGLFSIERP